MNEMLARTEQALAEAQAEIQRLRHALVYWNNDHNADSHDNLRDEVAAMIVAEADRCEDQPYILADILLGYIGGWYDKTDQTLYDLIPDDEWGIKL